MNRIAAILMVLLVPLAVHAQWERAFFVGRIVSHAFLEKLTNPRGTEYRVGMINSAASTGMLVSPEGARPAVKFMRGNGTPLWASAALQVDKQQGGAFRFEVINTLVEVNSCPMLEEAHATFYRDLNRVLSEEVPLNVLPVRPQVDTITVDGTTFPIQIYTGRDFVTIMADRDVDRELHDASYELHLIVSKCSNGVEGAIEEHTY